MHNILDEACLTYTYILTTLVSKGCTARCFFLLNSMLKFIFHFQGMIHIYVDSCKNLSDPMDPSYNASPMIEVASGVIRFLISLIVTNPVVQRKGNEKDVHQVLHKRSSHRAGLCTSQQKVKYFTREEKRQLTCLVSALTQTRSGWKWSTRTRRRAPKRRFEYLTRKKFFWFLF